MAIRQLVRILLLLVAQTTAIRNRRLNVVIDGKGLESAETRVKDEYIVEHPALQNAPTAAPTITPTCPTQNLDPDGTAEESAPPTYSDGQSFTGDGAATANPAPTPSPTLLFDLNGEGSEPTPIVTSTSAPTDWTEFADKHDRDDVVEHKCGMTASKRSDSIANLVVDLSGTGSLMNWQSPHFRSYDWIDQEDDFVICPGSGEGHDDSQSDQSVLQRYILVLFYFSMSGDEWNFCSLNEGSSECESPEMRWLSDVSECNWYGVKCDETGAVTHLDLPRNNLAGVLPVELFSLTSMNGVSLGHNGGIRGSVPSEIENWTQLVYLDVDDNELEGPFPNVYGISTLQAIDLNNNQFSGPISSAISQLTKLVVLQIENNLFDGALPLDAMAQNLAELVLFSSQGNNWDTRPNWEALCDWIPDRRAVTGPGYLQFLLADCDNDLNNLSQQGSTCSCCSVCF